MSWLPKMHTLNAGLDHYVHTELLSSLQIDTLQILQYGLSLLPKAE